ncbi:microsomal glutathione S-transferase 3 [Haematococcus lacustris]|uniref:Glutathione S-transferase 3, mitochondrial n=1 Tax=Haematococcus lacustris TaxID=44745 RepID=A0A699YKY4_HAELA|nr:microsomal glutathione S-transferase 3 [Haematococcus lacustris]
MVPLPLKPAAPFSLCQDTAWQPPLGLPDDMQAPKNLAHSYLERTAPRSTVKMASLLPASFGWVAGTCAAAALVHHIYMSIGVQAARKKYNVKYPTLYATEADTKDHKAYNCVQRAHQNCLENLPTFYALVISTGLKYPITASAAGMVYLAGKILYFNGYSSGDPEKRMQGAPSYLGLLTLLGTAVKMAIDAAKVYAK